MQYQLQNSILERQQDNIKSIADIYNNLGKVQYILKEYSQAILNWQFSLQRYQKLDNAKETNIIITNIKASKGECHKILK